jgi:hypothetical protein
MGQLFRPPSKWRGQGGSRKKSNVDAPRRACQSRVGARKKNIRYKYSFGRNSVAKNLQDKTPLNLVNLPSTIPKPPANLGPAGATLWRSIMAEYDIADAGGQALLEQAASAYDRAERLRIEIDRDGEVVRGRTGMREHPGLKIELASRSFVCRTLQRLGINLEAVRPVSGTRPKSMWSDHAD